MVFSGFRRPDGRFGVRSHVLVIPSVACSAKAAELIAEAAPECVALPNQAGCGQVAGDLEIMYRTLAGMAANPNVYGTIVVGLGCEALTVDELCSRISALTNKPLESLVIQKECGVTNTVAKGRAMAMQMAADARACKRTEADISELILGTECGGSDPTSGLAANPVIGELSDILVDMGATSILCETTEFIGAEHLLAERGATSKVGDDILRIVSDYERHLQNVGENLRKGNPTPGNIDGGITTIEEKSLGCIHKGGTRKIAEVLQYSARPSKKGLVIMDTPGFDVPSVTGMTAGGAQVIVFSTGLGTPTGSPIAPVIKLTGNKFTYETMREHMDLYVGGLIDGTSDKEKLGRELFDLVIRTAAGERTCAERMGFKEFSVSRLCNFV